MSGFIELTLINGTKTFVNVNKIDTIFTLIDGKTRITFNSDYIEVIESYDKVKDLINKS